MSKSYANLFEIANGNFAAVEEPERKLLPRVMTVPGITSELDDDQAGSVSTKANRGVQGVDDVCEHQSPQHQQICMLRMEALGVIGQCKGFVLSQAPGDDYGDVNAPPCKTDADCKGYCPYYYYCNYATNRCSCLNSKKPHLDGAEN